MLSLHTYIIVFIMALAIVVLCLAGLGIKILIQRHGEFKRHCSSMDPYTGKGGGCVCAKGATCANRTKHPYQPLEVNDELMEELKINQKR